ncbi:MAG: TIGR02147 family protein [Myxococcota bacterium]
MSATSHFSDYRAYLRNALKELGIKQIALARKMAMSPAWLSQILNGRRKLDPELAERCADALDFSERKRLEFLSLVEREVGNSTIIRGRAQRLLSGIRKPEVASVTRPEFQRQLSAWHIGAVLELARCEEYQADPGWVAATLRPRITVDQAHHALSCLTTYGYLDADFRLVADAPDAGTDREVEPGRKSNDIAEYHLLSLELAKRALTTVPPSDRLFLGASLALSESDFQELKNRFEEVVVQTLSASAQESPNRVYQISTAVFPVSLYSDSVEDPRTFAEDSP